MTAATVTRTALVASLASHLLLLGLPAFRTAPVPQQPPQELLPVRLVPAASPPERRQPSAQPPAQPVARPQTDALSQSRHQPAAAARTASPAPSAAAEQPAAPTAASAAPSPAPPATPASRPAAAATVGTAPAQPAAPRRSEYLALVRSLVERNKEYPSFARQAGQQGTVLVRVSIAENGSAAAVTIVQSSGHSQLDRAALSAVRQAAPFKPPGGFGLGNISIDIPIVYKLT